MKTMYKALILMLIAAPIFFIGCQKNEILDEAVDRTIGKLLYAFPNCISKSLTEVRKKKLEHWDANKESSREWLALNMMTEAKAGFRAFNDGPKHDREIDFVKLRQLLAEGHEWNDEMHRKISPQFKNTVV